MKPFSRNKTKLSFANIIIIIIILNFIFIIIKCHLFWNDTRKLFNCNHQEKKQILDTPLKYNLTRKPLTTSTLFVCGWSKWKRVAHHERMMDGPSLFLQSHQSSALDDHWYQPLISTLGFKASQNTKVSKRSCNRFSVWRNNQTLVGGRPAQIINL